ncbi:hypothetical protein C0075_24015, partial [Rhizobium sp. KAs_5_22]
ARVSDNSVDKGKAEENVTVRMRGHGSGKMPASLEPPLRAQMRQNAALPPVAARAARVRQDSFDRPREASMRRARIAMRSE